MKMFGPKSLSFYLFYLTRISTLGCLLLICFILVSLATNNYEKVNGQFEIAIPFATETYIRGFLTTNIITTITLVMSFFSLFFYMLSNIFKTFKARKLFTDKAIKQLNYFAVLNLVVAPVLILLIDFYIMKKPQIGNIFNYLLTILLGVFLLFLVAVFNKGYQVQKENDLTI